MSDVFNIEQLKEMSQPIIEIPGFDTGQTIKVKVKQPNIMSLMAQGKIPNHLLSTATEMFAGVKKEDKKDQSNKAKNIAEQYVLYCEICLVKPTYQEMKDIITDEQMETIFAWATKGVQQLDSFREDKKNGSNNNDGKTISKKA